MPNFSIKDYERHSEEIKRVTLKFYEWALDNKIHSLRIVIADQYYYDKSLQERMNILDATSTKFLCKTIIFENTAFNDKFEGKYYPKFIAVMVQYVAKINTEKLNKEMKLYQNKNAQEKAGKQYFHYRLVEQRQSNEMTGYQHNGVVPVLMKCKTPIIFSHQIEQLTPKYFWMGAGHPWIKMRCSFEDFKRTYNDELLVFDTTY